MFGEDVENEGVNMWAHGISWGLGAVSIWVGVPWGSEQCVQQQVSGSAVNELLFFSQNKKFGEGQAGVGAELDY